MTKDRTGRRDSGFPSDFRGGAASLRVMATTESTRSTAELVRAARGGDADAFADLVKGEQERLVGAATALLGDRAEAEDAAQDALVAAHANLTRLRDPARFRPWLYRILLNRARDRRRRRRRRRVRLFGDRATEVAAPAAVGHPRLDALARAVEELPEKYRRLISLHYVAGLDYAETAAAAGIPEKLVRSRLYDARRRLERSIPDEPEE